MIKRMVCIECPKGCNLSVDIENCKVIKVEGALCPKGKAYAVTEAQDPARIFTATILADGLSPELVPVRTNKPIPKRDLFRAMEEVKRLRIRRPLKAGDAVIENFLGLGVRLLATRQAVLGSGPGMW